MASHDQQLRNPRYRDWVKAGLALKYLKDGIEEFVNDETKEQQRSILQEVQKEIGRPGATCNSCPIDQLRAYKQGRYKRSNFCPYDICDRIFEKIVEQHMYRKPSWTNTDSTKWCTDHWEIAKCFLDGGGYGDKVSAADTDCKGLLSVITNNMFVQRNVDTPIDRFEPKTDVFSKSKEARNEILHLASLQLPLETLNSYVDVMIQLLEDKGKLHEHEIAKLAISKLRQLKETDLFISTEDEWEIREAALRAVQEKKQEALDEIEKKQNEVLEKLKIDKIQETLNELSKTSKKTSQYFSHRHESLEQRLILLERTLKKHQTETSKAVIELQQVVSSLIKDLSDLKSRFEIELQHKKRVDYLYHKKVIRRELFNMYTNYLSKMPLPPFLHNLNATVDEFYMELNIVNNDVYERQEIEKTDNKKKDSSDFLSGFISKIRVVYSKIVSAFRKFYFSFSLFANSNLDYQDIFYKKGKRVENVYILGDAGVGKTTWCLKLIDTWLRSLTNQETGSMHTFNLNENEKMMLEFDFVLFISLRHASKDVDITDMIRKQIFNQTPRLFEYMQEILNIEPDKFLVIADGLDEWNAHVDNITFTLGNDHSFPGRKNMNHCTVLTTTRRWKLNEAKYHLEKDIAVNISGLRGRNYVHLAEKIIHRLNQNVSGEIKNEKKVENFEQELHRCNFLHGDSVTKIPLILIFLVVKWFNDGSLESTMADNYSFMLKSLFEHEEGYRNIKPRYGLKHTLGGRLSQLSYIEETKREWSTDAEKLPECVKKHTVCGQYSRLILKLSEIAFEGLFERKDKVLIFSEESLREKLTSEEVEVAVQSGIVSKSDIKGQCNVSKLSYLHRTVQEFMAAIHLAGYHEDATNTSFQEFQKFCSADSSLYEMKNVILFSIGLDANLAKKILIHVCNVENQTCFQRRNSLLHLLVQCFNELRDDSSVASMPMLPLNAFIPGDMQPLNVFLDFLETNVDKLSLKHVKVEKFDNQGLGVNRLLDILSSEMIPLCYLTTLTLGQISGESLYLRTNKRVVFRLQSLENLELRYINTRNISKEGMINCVLDFSHSRNIKNVNLGFIYSCRIHFSGTHLRELYLESLNSCHVGINDDVVIQSEELFREENGMFQLQYINVDCIHIQDCFNSKVSINYPSGHYKMYSIVAKISLLTCVENYLCKLEIDLNIHIVSLSLKRPGSVPKIRWKEINTIVLDGVINSEGKVYTDVLDGISVLHNLTTLRCIGCDQFFISEILKTVGSMSSLNDLEIFENETYTTEKKYANDFQRRQLTLTGSGLRIAENARKCNALSFFSTVEGLYLSDVSRLMTNDIELVRSLVNLKRLICHSIAEEEFIILGECFQYLTNLEEVELSHFRWFRTEKPSPFSCLEKIKKLKTLHLVKFSQEAIFALSLRLSNLSLSNIILDNSCQGITRCLNNMQMLKKLIYKRSAQNVSFLDYRFYGLIKNLKQIEFLKILKPDKNDICLDNIFIATIDLSEFAHLKYILLEEVLIFSEQWETFVNCLPKNGQLQILEFSHAVVLVEKTEQMFRSTPGFVCQKLERVCKYLYNIILKAK